MRYLVLYRYFNYCSSREYRRPIVDIGIIVIYLVDLSVYCRSKGHWRIKDGIWSCVRSLSCYVCVCSCSTFLVTPWLRGMVLYCHLFAPFTWVRVASSTRAQSRGTRTLVRRDTSDRRWPWLQYERYVDCYCNKRGSPCRKLGLAKCNATKASLEIETWVAIYLICNLRE